MSVAWVDVRDVQFRGTGHNLPTTVCPKATTTSSMTGAAPTGTGSLVEKPETRRSFPPRLIS